MPILKKNQEAAKQRRTQVDAEADVELTPSEDGPTVILTDATAEEPMVVTAPKVSGKGERVRQGSDGGSVPY